MEMVDGIRKSGFTTNEMWASLYKRACDRMVSDASKILQSKFFVDTKLVSRETSSLLDTFASGQSGVKISFNLSRYTRLHVITIAVFSQAIYADVPIRFYEDDADGELLLTKTVDLVAGKNTITVDTDFEVDNLFITINSSTYTVRATENKFYHGMDWTDNTVCFECCGGEGSVQQINGGGINAKYNVFCSVEKFVCENINLFKYALLWRIGVEITQERRFGERLNRFTTMTAERAEELNEFYNVQYEQEMSNCLKSQNIEEDAACFQCKSFAYTDTSLP